MPREESFAILLKYIDVTRTTDPTLDVMLEKNIDDYRNSDDDRGLSDTWTDVTRFTILHEKPPDGYTWSRERLTRKQTSSRLDCSRPEIWKDMSEASKRREKQKCSPEHSVLGQLESCSEEGMFYQTRSNAIILHNAVPAACIEKVVAISSREVLNNKKMNLIVHRETCTRTGLA